MAIVLPSRESGRCMWRYELGLCLCDVYILTPLAIPPCVTDLRHGLRLARWHKSKGTCSQA